MLRYAGSSIARARWSALALALLVVGISQVRAVAVPAELEIVAFPVAQLLTMVLVVALIRVLAAYRPEPMPAPPAVDDEGRPVGVPARIPAVSADDRSPRVALRRAAAMATPLLRYVGLELLLLAAAVLLVLPFAGESLGVTSGEELDPRDAFAVTAPLELVAALFTAFVALVPQRIGLEGDPRVLVGAAHSVRVARTMFGPMFLLSLLWMAPGLGGSALLVYDGPVAARVAVALLAVPLHLAVVAGFNEVYARGPRLDVPADFGSRRR